MIGLDTNVLVRDMVRNDPARTRLGADRCVDHQCSREAPGYISHLVPTELIRVLERGYGFPRPRLGEVLGTLLSSEEIRIQGAPLIRVVRGAFFGRCGRFWRLPDRRTASAG